MCGAMPLAAIYSARVVAWRIPYQHYCIKSTTLLMHTRYITTALCIILLFFLDTKLFSCGRGSFLALSAAGHAGGARVHTAQVWAPAEVHVTCSERSKPQNLASNDGVAFRVASASQVLLKTRTTFRVPGVTNMEATFNVHVYTSSVITFLSKMVLTNLSSPPACGCVFHFKPCYKT